ncbi:hypothetical protein HYQ46_010859 [Verticillium longisporum]|nr:hypothetical protein HYQ46_010859 [Verticillium longisporum]
MTPFSLIPKPFPRSQITSTGVVCGGVVWSLILPLILSLPAAAEPPLPDNPVLLARILASRFELRSTLSLTGTAPLAKPNTTTHTTWDFPRTPRKAIIPWPGKRESSSSPTWFLVRFQPVEHPHPHQHQNPLGDYPLDSNGGQHPVLANFPSRTRTGQRPAKTQSQ